MTLHPSFGALAFVLVGTVSFHDRDSYEMTAVWPGHRVEWSLKQGSDCFILGDAITHSRLADVPASAVLTCAYKPGLFTPRSNCIKGYHGPRKDGYCAR